MPHGWETAKLGDLLSDSQNGFPSGMRSDDGVVQVRMNNLDTEGRLDLQNSIRVPADADQVEKYRLLDGDVLFNNTNSAELVGKSALFRGNGEPVVFSNHFTRLRTQPLRMYSGYLAWWLVCAWKRGDFARMSNQWVNQSAIRKDALLALTIPFPKSITEQRRIADILDEADALRRKRSEALRLANDLVPSLFNEMFGNPVSNPKHKWNPKSLSDLVRGGTEVTYGIVQCGPHVPDGVPYVRTSDMTADRLDVTQMGRTAPEIASKFTRSRVEKDELVISIRASVGTVHLVPPELDGGNLTQGTARIAPGPDADKLWLLWALRSSGAQRWLNQQSALSGRPCMLRGQTEQPIGRGLNLQLGHPGA
jgi:type I restriction enzyme S subunit